MNSTWSVWKDIGYPGTVHIPAPDGRTHVYNFTHDDWRKIVATGRQKVREGWNIPTCWEHQDVLPAKKKVKLSGNADADYAQSVFASIEDFDLTPDGRAKALVSGTDLDDYDQLKKVKFVSPEIVWNWRDTDGQLWRGPSVTHLAATPRPVQRHQNPIGSDPDRVPPGLRVNSLEKLVRMSLPNSANGPRVAARLRLSIDHYATSGARNMADEDTTTGNDGPDKSKKMSPWEKMAQSLSAHCGIQMGDVSAINTPDEFARLLDVACMNYKAGSEPEVPDDDELPPNPDEGEPPPGDMEQPPAGAEEAPAPPVRMSITAENKPLADKLIAKERRDLVTRAEKVRKSGALAPALADALVEECKTCRLSLAANGDCIPNDTTKKLKTLEGVKAGTTVPVKGSAKARLGQPKPKNTKVVEVSPDLEQGEIDTDQIVDAWDKT